MRAATSLLAALAALAPAAGAAPGAVLVVGDSLERGTAPMLRRELAELPLRIDARSGRRSSEGVAALRDLLKPSDSAVVFSLGTNDPSPRTLAASLGFARALADQRCLVVATLVRPMRAGAPVAAMNVVVERFAAASSATRVADWHAAAAGETGLVRPDGVHPTAVGVALRARLVADAVRSCLAPREPAAAAPARAPAPAGAAAPAPDATLEPRAAPAKPPGAASARRGPPPRRPARLRWAHVERLPGLGAVLAVGRDAVALIGSGNRHLRAAVIGPPPEPILGAG